MSMQRDTDLDLEHLEKYVMGDETLRTEVLDIFTEQATSVESKFDPMQNDEMWYDLAHSFKGAARGVGAWALGELCEEAETLIKNTPNKADKRATILVSIRAQLARTLLAVNAIRPAA